MKDRLGKMVKMYGIYALLAAALLISAAATVFSTKSDSNSVVIYAESSDTEDSGMEESMGVSETTRNTKKTTSPKESTLVLTTTKAPKETSPKTTGITTEKFDGDVTYEEVTEITFPIDINLVNFEELTAINGIGESTANAILEYRDSVGVITYIEQLLEISGIGESKLAMLSQYLYVDDADYSPPETTTTVSERPESSTTTATTTTTTTVTTAPPVITTSVNETEPDSPEPERQEVNINAADASEIAECLLIDTELAEKIIETREILGGQYENFLQLLYVKGISEEFLNEIRDYIKI